MDQHLFPIAQRRADLSQHFLRDPEFVRRLVAALPLDPAAPVIDIGAGTGIIAAALGDAGYRVIAVEKDVRLFRPLRARFLGRTNVECHHDDFLRFRLPEQPYSVVANLPFGITAAVMRRLLTASRPPEQAFLVVQREAAAKFTGVPRQSLFSLLHAPWFEIRVVSAFRRCDFVPPPRVTPVLLHLHRRPSPLLLPPLRPRWHRFVQSALGRGPDIRAGLRLFFDERSCRKLARELQFDLTSRPSELSLEQWLALFQSYQRLGPGRDPPVRAGPGDILFLSWLSRTAPSRKPSCAPRSCARRSATTTTATSSWTARRSATPSTTG